MANYQILKADIDEKIYENAQQKITGENLNSVLNAMVATLGAEYQFAGVATKDTNPETTDAKVFYIANGKGTYTHFDNVDVTEDDVVILYYDTSWHKVATGIASHEKLTELELELGFRESLSWNKQSYSFDKAYLLKSGNVVKVSGESFPVNLIVNAYYYENGESKVTKLGELTVYNKSIITTLDRDYYEITFYGLESNYFAIDITIYNEDSVFQGLPDKCKILDTIDDEPTAGSNNLVKSGGVNKSVALINQQLSYILKSQVFTITSSEQKFEFPLDYAVKTGNKVQFKIEFENLVITRVLISTDASHTNKLIDDITPTGSPIEYNIVSNADLETYYIYIFSTSPNNNSLKVDISYGDNLIEQVESNTEDITDNKEHIDYVELNSIGLTKRNFFTPAHIYYVNGEEEVSENRYGSHIYEVQEGEEYLVTLDNTDALYSIIALDSNKSIIANDSVAGSVIYYKYTVKSGTRYLYFVSFLNDSISINPVVEKEYNNEDTQYNGEIFKQGYIIDSNGNLEENSNYYLSDYIPVNKGDIIIADGFSNFTSSISIACFEQKQHNSIRVDKSLITAHTPYRNFIVPEDVKFVRFCSSDISNIKINIVRSCNYAAFKNHYRDNIILKGFENFDNSNWSVNNNVITSPSVNNTWSFSKYNVDFSEDDCSLCCMIIPKSFNGNTFEAGIGRITDNQYIGVTAYASISKDSNASYLKIYRYNYSTSSMEEVVEKRVTLSKNIELEKEYFIKMVKTTTTKGVINVYVMDSIGNIIGETTTLNEQWWGCVACMVFNGTTTFKDYSFSYPKIDFPKVLILGDSFVEGATIPSDKEKRWCGMLKEILGRNNCIICGRGGANLVADGDRYSYILNKIDATYTIIESVANDNVIEYWEEPLKMYINMCKINGSIPILTTYAPIENATQEQIDKITYINNWVRESGYNYIDINKALSDDGINPREGYVLDDGLHPSILGHLAIFNRLKIDCPFLVE